MAAPSKLRELRDKINTETDALANVVRDLFHIEKKSHLKYLKAARCYLSKSKKLANIPQAFTPQLDRFIDSTLVDEVQINNYCHPLKFNNYSKISLKSFSMDSSFVSITNDG